MRKPKSPGIKGPAVQRPPPGGRALERLKQFARARGLPVRVEAAKVDETKGKTASVTTAKKSKRK
jgi:hypothetical protein